LIQVAFVHGKRLGREALETLEREACKLRDIVTFECLMECGQGRAEKCGMSKSNQVCSGVAANSKVTLLLGGRKWLEEIKLPKASGGCALALQYRLALICDGDTRFVEGYIATSVTELSNR
jgi:hypothetical protein